MSDPEVKPMDPRTLDMIQSVTRHAVALAKGGEVKRHAKVIVDKLRDWAFETYGVMID
jgi:hypothetical protein